MDRRRVRQQEIIKLMLPHVEGNAFDMSGFRAQNPKAYNRISYNFGSVQNAVHALEAEVGSTLTVKTVMVGAHDINAYTLRNHLAYDHLRELRKIYSLQEIAKHYGFSRQLISQVFNQLEHVVGKDNEKDDGDSKP